MTRNEIIELIRTRLRKFRVWWEPEGMMTLEEAFDSEIVYPRGESLDAHILATVMQHTGRQDTDGTDIYEGDIVRAGYTRIDANGSVIPVFILGVVVAASERTALSWGLRCADGSFYPICNTEWFTTLAHRGVVELMKRGMAKDAREPRVIGNIFQTPELWEGEECERCNSG